MSFSVITIGSPVGPASTATIVFDYNDGLSTINTRAVVGSDATPVSLQGLFSGAVDTSGLNKPFSGWLTYSGGGGSTRPSSGFLYPRGDN